jgi:Na+-transporting NADH:ubiquinone oxidoreductase subunit NqrF
MTRTLKVIGLASKTMVKEIIIPEHFHHELTLMNFLISNGITVASSCDGAGVCNKCVCNKTLLSCQITLNNFLKTSTSAEVTFAYL